VENIKQLYLIGMMGSGKSSTGKALSFSLGWEFIDIDSEITKTYNLTINELFSKGEEYFRELECAEIKKHILKENVILAVGGGAVTYEESFNLLGSKLCIYLKTSKNILLDRLQGDKSRPLLNVENKEEVLEKIIRQREQKYQALCNYEMSTDNMTIKENCEKIMEMINV
tara:strand:- start:170 stop:679 length:510 start_codon:yes stop_codon:yes gene_type:complete